MRFLPPTPNPLVWVILAASGAATCVAGSRLGFSAPGPDVFAILWFACALMVLAILAHNVLKAPAVVEPLALCGFWATMVVILLPASYIAAGFNMPLVDAQLAMLDEAIGFDWRWLQKIFAANDWLAWTSNLIYRASIVQVLIASLALAATRDLVRLNSFFTGLLIATVVLVVLSALFPALGAYSFYGLTSAEVGHIREHISVSGHLHDVAALRNGSLRDLSAVRWDGIITFPSYHAIVAITAGWATWRLRWIGPFNAVFTALVVLTSLPIGGHHLIDMVGAATVCAASLWAAHIIESRRLSGVEAPVPAQSPSRPRAPAFSPAVVDSMRRIKLAALRFGEARLTRRVN